MTKSKTIKSGATAWQICIQDLPVQCLIPLLGVIGSERIIELNYLTYENQNAMNEEPRWDLVEAAKLWVNNKEELTLTSPNIVEASQKLGNWVGVDPNKLIENAIRQYIEAVIDHPNHNLELAQNRIEKKISLIDCKEAI